MIEESLGRLARVSQTLSLSGMRTLLPERFQRLFIECYVLSFAVLLTVVVNLATTTTWGWAGLAAYRVIDIVSYRVYFFLLKSKNRPWARSTLRRSLLLACCNLYELAMGFAVLYLYSGQVKSGALVLANATSAVYFSTVTMFTVGYYVPIGPVAQLIVCAQLVSVLTMFTFVFPALVSLFSSRDEPQN